MKHRTDLSRFQNPEYNPGPIAKRALWFVVNALVFQNPVLPFSGLKCSLLRLFGAKVGRGVVIKPSVNIKHPWLLTIGDHTWIGEGVWIDNLAQTRIGSNVCLSQGAMLLCGNHDYTKSTFDLITGEIAIDDGAWIGAQALVGPGVTVGNHAVLAVKSVATNDLEPYTVYRGNPAAVVRERSIAS
jgi:putative colanic acid biosynthesis acetyltransferase WcaF